MRRLHTRRRGRHRTVLLALAVAGGGAVAPADDGPDAAGQGLEPRPVEIEALGLSFHPPSGSQLSLQRVGERVTATLVDGAEVPLWSMRIQTVTSRRPDLTPADHVAELLETWRRSDHPFTVIHNEPVAGADPPRQLCYVTQAATDALEVVTGWLVVDRSNRDLLVFTFQCLPEHMPQVRGVLEASFTTIRLRPIDQIIDERRRRLDSGQAFLESLSPERLRTLIGEQALFRYYVPAGTGASETDTEIGWVTVEFLEERRGATTPARDETDYDPSESELGLLVRVRGRVIADADRAVFYDSEALYWMAWDQSTETWSVRGTHRQKQATRSEAETGVRPPRSAGEPAGTLTVITSSMDGARRDPRQWRLPDVYMSQPLKWALGRLLPREPVTARTFGYYFYDSAAAKLSLRIDRWEPSAGDGGTWTLTSRARSDADAVVSVFDAQGRVVRRTWPDGSMTEPVTKEHLRRLWASKGLGEP